MDILTDAHILVVDDDTRLRSLLKDFLRRMGYRITTAKSAADAEAKMLGLVFDLMVLDVMMPGEDGFAFSKRLRKSGIYDEMPILLLTAMGESGDRIRGFEGGVDDYLVKPFEPQELVLRINAILRRARPTRNMEHEITEITPVVMGGFRFDCLRRELSFNGNTIKLTSGELALLGMLAKRQRETVSRRELCDVVAASSERAVDVQITRLRKKIENDPKRPRYIQTVWGEGYVLVPDNRLIGGGF